MSTILRGACNIYRVAGSFDYQISGMLICVFRQSSSLTGFYAKPFLYFLPLFIFVPAMGMKLQIGYARGFVVLYLKLYPALSLLIKKY